LSSSPAAELLPPATDPTPIFEAFRGSYGSELLTAAVAHFNVFNRLAERAQSFDELREELGLQRRPTIVLTTALRALGLLVADTAGRFALSPLARQHLTRTSRFDVSDYVGLAASSPGVLEMVERLRSNRPAGADTEQGAAFIFRDGMRSAMEHASLARHFTLALAGRAKNVAPVLAQRLLLDGIERILDVGGGTGMYSIALLRRHPRLRAVVLDREEVLKIAAEMAAEHGVADRVELVAGDMFRDPLPSDCQAVLLSNILHDWDEPECLTLIERCAAALPAGGRLWIHDVFLNDALDGPLPIALYSAALFTLTEGRAYSRAEYRGWLPAAGFEPEENFATLIHCGVLGAKRA
jgi:predicted O-methyltransferase YrrM